MESHMGAGVIDTDPRLACVNSAWARKPCYGRWSDAESSGWHLAVPILYEKKMNLMTFALRESKSSDHAAVVMIATAAWFW